MTRGRNCIGALKDFISAFVTNFKFLIHHSPSRAMTFSTCYSYVEKVTSSKPNTEAHRKMNQLYFELQSGHVMLRFKLSEGYSLKRENTFYIRCCYERKGDQHIITESILWNATVTFSTEAQSRRAGENHNWNFVVFAQIKLYFSWITVTENR